MQIFVPMPLMSIVIRLLSLSFEKQMGNSITIGNVVQMACLVISGKLVALQGHLFVIVSCNSSIAFG